MSGSIGGLSRLDPRPELASLRTCLLSGGDSRRMGTDKAMLSHPNGGTWLEQALQLLAGLGAPLTLVSRHRAHGRLARQLNERLGLEIEVLLEPPPREGPLLALTRLMALYPGQRLLLAPVDMPRLELESLRALVAAAEAGFDPDTIHLAHDGRRLQPLLGLYPATPSNRAAAEAFTGRGGRSLLRWLEQNRCVSAVELDPAQLLNANTPGDCRPGPGDGFSGSAPG
ncbi:MULTISPECIES: molybdenum cofactor guanylyltransferase [unclassified Synechococcus]|uniref:molybdenum cofactor guanylyltransferase n=1 Tax=unclassified Synechococcus TaxID=2626047 RepID=UPI00006999BF|nr:MULTISPECIES: molybdenum cofactor guanylyltransferase [unclassified Synechococcus]EAQ76552.1 molybdopterin-guanine dinucleotide biosynthesis protein A [Synechococcus sp. WH 5701]WFN59262.1 molybdenum cofactor guanylyltransferase [Synechococcus sp. CCFWC 502]